MSDFFAPAPEPKTPLGRLRILSSTAGIRVSPLALGGMSLGDQWSHGLGEMTKDSSFKLLDAFVDAGGNFIDTANHYQNEQSESIIGEWMATRQIRDRMIIATKYTCDFRAWEIGKGTAANYSGNHRKSMRLSLQASLKKLQTDYVDILYLHFWDHSSSLKEIMDSLHMLVEGGKVLYLGISDTPAWIVAAANEYALANGKTPFSIYQGHWSVIMRDLERDVIPMARHYGMAIAPWGAVGMGKFQTKAQIREKEKKGETLRAFCGSQQTEPEQKISLTLEKVADEIGEGYSITAVALAWILAKCPRVFPIVGGRKVEHLQDNIRALNIKLKPEQIQELESVVPHDTGFPMNFIGPDPKVDGSRGGPLLAGSAYIDWLQSEKPIGYA
ncbi:MAG: hypothetical protein Q9227_001855 [Pyrenula ochraceoflavens]